MNKYPLIGVSICAVVLLILGSLTNVVGYQSVKSTSMNDSPLFKTRTQKATNQQQNIITSQYLGMGKGTLLQFPTRDNQTDSLKRAIEYIKKMDDKTFNKFTDLYLYQLQKKGKTTDMNVEQMVQGLRYLRDGSEYFGIYDNGNMRDITWRDTPTLCWFPGCVLFLIFIIIYFALYIIAITSYNCPTTNITCEYHLIIVERMKL